MSLNELTADEFFDVYRAFLPNATREEFEVEWRRFQRFKADYLRHRSVQ